MSITTPSAPLPLVDSLLGDASVALFENNLDPDGVTRVFRQALGAVYAWDAASVPGALAVLDAAIEQGEWITIAADYELGYALEPRLAPLLPTTGRPLLTALRWGRCDLLDRESADTLFAAVLRQLPADAANAGVAGLNAGEDSNAYRNAVERIRRLIGAGDCYQVNFTFPATARCHGDPLALYCRLRDSQAVRYGGFVRHAGRVTLSRSPELFVAREGQRLTTRPMKGTAPVGQAQALRTSAKDRAENLMIVDLLRNDLGRLAPKGGVRVTNLFEIEDYATVHQMTSTVVAEPVDARLGEIIRALFPCGSVTGAPKIRAMEIIRELEASPRGLYCGALGWISPDGDFSLNVPIRTLEIDEARNVTLGIGSGIVADSEATSEWAECAAKARFLTALEPAFDLFETLRFEGGRHPYPLQALHLARLGRSAAALGFRFDSSAIRVLLARTASELEGMGNCRVRIALAANGEATISHARLDPLPEQPSVMLATDTLDSGDPLLAHKTTRRTLYDRALQTATAAGHFDALFFNQAGELCEGARSNVFLRIGGELLTPPLHCGLLPGVMRQALLEAGQARERVLHRADIERAEAIYVSNALRGLVAVSIAA